MTSPLHSYAQVLGPAGRLKSPTGSTGETGVTLSQELTSGSLVGHSSSGSNFGNVGNIGNNGNVGNIGGNLMTSCLGGQALGTFGVNSPANGEMGLRMEHNKAMQSIHAAQIHADQGQLSQHNSRGNTPINTAIMSSVIRASVQEAPMDMSTFSQPQTFTTETNTPQMNMNSSIAMQPNYPQSILAKNSCSPCGTFGKPIPPPIAPKPSHLRNLIPNTMCACSTSFQSFQQASTPTSNPMVYINSRPSGISVSDSPSAYGGYCMHGGYVPSLKSPHGVQFLGQVVTKLWPLAEASNEQDMDRDSQGGLSFSRPAAKACNGPTVQL